MDGNWSTALLSGLIAGTVAILVTVAIERTGGLIGGVLGTTPSTIIPASIGIALASTSSQQVQAAMATVPIGMAMDGLYLLQWRYIPACIPPSWPTSTHLPLILLLTTLTWLLLAAAALALTSAVAAAGGLLALRSLGVGGMALTAVAGVAACWVLPPTPPGSNPVKPCTLASRGLFAGAAITVSVLATQASVTLGGLLSTFPAIFATTMVALWVSQGQGVTLGAVGPMVLGGGSVSAYATLFGALQPQIGIAWAAAAAWAVAVIGWSLPAVLFLRWRRRASPPGDGFGHLPTVGGSQEEEGGGLILDTGSVVSEEECGDLELVSPTDLRESGTSVAP